jgi:nicotinate phosphoribosyltransferase
MISGLTADFYELTMAAGYWQAGMVQQATFELFVRSLPPARSFLVAAGLDPALGALERLQFSDQDCRWLREQPQFAAVPAGFYDFLRELRFRGDVWAIPEGTPVFPNEPLLRVTAPLPQAQLVETMLLATITFQTSVATKAARLVRAADGRAVVEFGARRAHGIDAGIAAARAAFVGGCQGTSLAEAARRFGIPASGTMAHAWVQAFPAEVEAFETFSRTFGSSAVYLLDTYDTRTAAESIVRAGLRPTMVRLDSGDLDALSRQVRGVLDGAGLSATRILATGDLDEYRIERLVEARAPIDGFGVGTALSTVSDAPALGGVYKLVEIDRAGKAAGVAKFSPGKQTWPGPKQVWRLVRDGRAVGDLIAGAGEAAPAGAVPLLEPAMQRGRRVGPDTPLAALQDRCRERLAILPDELKALDRQVGYPVRISDALEAARLALAPKP